MYFDPVSPPPYNSSCFDFKNWWSEETGRAFADKQQCFIDQYNNYGYPILSTIPDYRGPTHVNGVQTLGENIAGKTMHAVPDKKWQFNPPPAVYVEFHPNSNLIS